MFLLLCRLPSFQLEADYPVKIGIIIAGERPALFRSLPRERSCNVASSPTFHILFIFIEFSGVKGRSDSPIITFS